MEVRSRAVWVSLAVLLWGAALYAAAPDAASLAGRWDAIVVANDVEVPFPFEIEVEGSSVKGSFFNGERRITSTEGKLVGDKLTLQFGQYATTLEATLKDDTLEGEYVRSRGAYPFRASRASGEPPAPSADVPSIDGTWITSADSKKGEDAWRFVASQKGASVEATILRVDGDTGTLTGSFRDGKFVLSHFSGARPLLLEVTPQDDGTLVLELNKKTELHAARAGTAAAADIGTPTDSGRFTHMKDPSEPFRFSFPDLEGKIVSNTDEQFQGKVVLVSIGGSWCPNCHDEAPFLVSLYDKFRDEGFEIVLLSFEEGKQLENPERLRAFIADYGIEYTVLLPGEPKEASAKVPQAVNLSSFPTTFILGRDGLVRAIHAGFPSPGSGKYYEEAEREITETVEKLLAEDVGAS
jgi:peroxiredoxin